MAKLKTLIPILMALAALVLIVVQQARVDTLETQLADVVRQSPTPPAVPRVARDDARADKRAIEVIAERVRALENEVRAASALARTATKQVLAASTDDELLQDSELPDLVDELSSLRADVDALLQGRGVETPEAKATIRDAIDTARSERREERRARAAARRQAWLDSFIAENGLTEVQGETLRSIEDDFLALREATRSAVRAGETTREEAREALRTAREENQATLKELLDEEQLGKYQNRPRGGGGRGGFGRPGRR